ncbi:BRN [Mytilus coruscus]|uniref:Hexosyltransferase n=1 Tax=Mytilus coruscus TaxID=42192 RepID=A0A6J7ZY98_MYTCO|nr:BRN [Mytilus coruscus]
MVVMKLKKKELLKFGITLTCVVSLLLLLYKQYNWDTLYDVPNLEKVINDIQHKRFSHVNPLNELSEKHIYKINPAKSISKTTDRDSLQLIFIVKSYILNFGQRIAIRRTWGGRTSLRSKTVFIVGYLDGTDDLIKQESRHYKDIVQLNVADQYENVVYKTIYSLLWLSHGNTDAEFIHFVDDDRLVNPINIYDFATNNIDSADLVMVGYKLEAVRPSRNKSSKTYLSSEEYSFSFFPPYIIGGTILTNIKTVRILAIAITFLKVIPIEDAYIGIVAKSVNIKLKHHYRFLPFKQSPFTLWNTASSPGYETTYSLLRDWNLIRAMNS